MKKKKLIMIMAERRDYIIETKKQKIYIHNKNKFLPNLPLIPLT